ncbi:MAG: hypothetical protein K8S54_13995 [Spirochaetia bacterium]|nr:hypothetical protein [Spirochaetia bacterium]
MRSLFPMKRIHKVITMTILSLLLATCAKKKSSDNSLIMSLLLLTALSQTCSASAPADIVFERGFPGSNNTVAGFSFPGVGTDYTVTINGVSATGITLPNASSLEFTMPTLSGITTENTTVPMIISKGGSAYISKTVRYRPLLSVSLGQPNTHNPKIDQNDDSAYFIFTAGTHTVSAAVTNSSTYNYGNDTNTSHILNAYGYSGATLNLHSLTSATAAFTTVASGNKGSSVFKKIMQLTNGSQYIIRVQQVSGSCLNFKFAVAKGQIKGTDAVSEIDYPAFSSNLCYDTLGTSSTGNANDCFSKYNTVGKYSNSRNGRCTYPSDSGITTRNFYGPGYSTGYSAGACTQTGGGSSNEMDAIFEDN